MPLREIMSAAGEAATDTAVEKLGKNVLDDKIELPDDSGERKYSLDLPDDSGERMPAKVSANNDKGDLRASSKYELNNYRYETDAQGRISHVHGNLRLEEADRDLNAQRKVGKEGGDTGYDGGHIIASQFGGDGGIGNLIPMKSDLNRAGGGYYKMEQELKCALKEGHTVKLDVKMTYQGDSKVPSKIVATYEISGTVSKRVFDNIGGSK